MNLGIHLITNYVHAFNFHRQTPDYPSLIFTKGTTFNLGTYLYAAIYISYAPVTVKFSSEIGISIDFDWGSSVLVNIL